MDFYCVAPNLITYLSCFDGTISIPFLHVWLTSHWSYFCFLAFADLKVSCNVSHLKLKLYVLVLVDRNLWLRKVILFWEKKNPLSLGFNFVSGHICVWIITALPYTFGAFVQASVDLVIANYYEGCISSFYFKIPSLFFSVFAYSVVFSEVYILVAMTS